MKRHLGAAAASCAPSSLVVSSPAKLNLFLEVLSRRPDGYHDIVTLFERISLADTVTLTLLAGDEIIVDSTCPDIPLNKENLAWKAAELIKRTQGVSRGVKIEIEKNIPIGAGLGGGSSNAASVLCGLDRLFGLRLSQKTLITYANGLGSDVAFFILAQRFALGEGRGERLRAVDVPPRIRLWHILFFPPVSVMTKDVYRLWDQGGRGRDFKKSLALTKKGSDVNILLSLLRRNRIIPLNRRIHNGLSATVMASYGLVSQLKDDLLAQGLVERVHMSGSGPTLFTVHRTQEEAMEIVRILRRRFARRCRMFVASSA